jgi:hypothetical protein
MDVSALKHANEVVNPNVYFVKSKVAIKEGSQDSSPMSVSDPDLDPDSVVSISSIHPEVQVDVVPEELFLDPIDLIKSSFSDSVEPAVLAEFINKCSKSAVTTKPSSVPESDDDSFIIFDYSVMTLVLYLITLS